MEYKDYRPLLKLWYKLLELPVSDRNDLYRYLTDHTVFAIELLEYIYRYAPVETDSILTYIKQNGLMSETTVRRTLTTLRKQAIVTYRQSPNRTHRHYQWSLSEEIRASVRTVTALFET